MAGGRPGDFPDFTYGEDGIPHPVPFNFYDPFKFSKNMSPEKSEKVRIDTATTISWRQKPPHQ